MLMQNIIKIYAQLELKVRCVCQFGTCCFRLPTHCLTHGDIMKNTQTINLNKNNKIESLIDVSLDKVRSLIDVNCVVGNAISMPDNSVIIPISKVSVGFVSGGGEYSDLNAKRNSADFPMAGGTGGGFTVTPIGFFVVNNNKFKIIHADKSTAYLGLIKNATEVLKKFVGNMK